MFRTILFCFILSFFLAACSQESVNEFAAAMVKGYAGRLIPTERPKTAKPNAQSTPDNTKMAQRISIAITPTNREVRFCAVSMAKRYPGPYNVGQVCAIWQQVKTKWKYVNDPRGQEYFAPASETFWTVGGDCDDFAIFIASLIEAIGGSARIVVAHNENSGHAYAEVYMAKTQSEAKALCEAVGRLFGTPQGTPYHYHKAPNGYWLNLDWSAAHPGGPFFKATQEIYVYPNGTWE